MHEAEEAWYIMEGELKFWIGEESFAVSPGSFVLAPGGVPHSLANTGSMPAKYLVLFSPRGLERFFSNLAHLADAARPDQVSQEAFDALADRYGIRKP